MAIEYRKTGPTESLPPSKVTLTKESPKVSLAKRGASTGILRVNLNWNSRPSRERGLFKGRGSGIDLDLGCLYQFVGGDKGVVQALGDSFTASPSGIREPVIWLDGDDRSGSNSAGENLYINLAHVDRIHRVLIFALIYEGVPNWAAADGVVTLFSVGGPPIEVRLDEAAHGSRICGIAMLEKDGGGLSVRREVNYINGSQSHLDRAYGWGMNWTPGRK